MDEFLVLLQAQFVKTALDEVFTILSRQYKEEIVLAAQVKKCKFTGDLSGLTFEEALKVVSLSASLKVESSDNKLYITGPGCD